MKLVTALERRGKHFLRAAYAVLQARTRGGGLDAYLKPDDVEARRVVQRTVTPPTVSSDFHDYWREFLVDLAPYSAAARLIAQAVPAALNVDGTAHYPVRAGRAVPTWVGEGGAIPVVNSVLDDVEIGPPKKMAHIVVWSSETDKRRDARALFEKLLREDVGAGLDAAFLSTSAASAASPAGLLYGAPTVTPTGAGEAAAKDDLKALGEAVSAGGSGAVTFIMAPARLAGLRVLAPALIPVLDLAASAAVPADRVVAVDAASLIVATDPAPDIEAGSHATLDMNTSPAASALAGDSVRSLWQTGSVALRVIHEIDFKARRDGAVAYADGVAW